MATKKQIAANRRNAKKSTGPRTAAGKAKAAQNATKHGLLARQPVLPDEDGAEYEELRLSLIHELWPETPAEKLLVNRLAATQWRLARVPVIEAELLERLRRDAQGNVEGLGAAWARDAGPYGGALARLSRYETALERNAARLLAELRRLQREGQPAERREAQAAGHAEQGPWWERAAAAWPGAPGPQRERPQPAPPAAPVSPALGGGRGLSRATSRGAAPTEFPNEPTARPAGAAGAATPPAGSSGANGSGTPGEA
jgi:hypothetical protein